MSTRNTTRARLAGLALTLAMAAGPAAAATPGESPVGAMPTIREVPPAALPSAHFDAAAATAAYMALIPPASRIRSDAYFEGGYWLILCDLVTTVAISLLLLTLGWSARMRDTAERMTRFGPLRTILYWAQYATLTSMLGLPLAMYEGFFRERRYGMVTQGLGSWLGDQAESLLLSVILGGVVVAALFGIVRRLPGTWWLWGAVTVTAVYAAALIVFPVYIAPLFNRTTVLKDPQVSGPILRLARANGIPAHDVYEIDTSRRTTRMSANVSGLGSTTRITLNDNLLARATSEEVQAVMAHEIGHYVLHHAWKMILEYGVVFVLWFAGLRRLLARALARRGARWKIRDVGDTAVLPLAVACGAVLMTLLGPATNAFIRTQEHEADIFALNASRQPDGFAQAAIHLGEYRKMDPGSLEEILFFDHPSGRERIEAAMRWKAENLPPAAVGAVP